MKSGVDLPAASAAHDVPQVSASLRQPQPPPLGHLRPCILSKPHCFHFKGALLGTLRTPNWLQDGTRVGDFFMISWVPWGSGLGAPGESILDPCICSFCVCLWGSCFLVFWSPKGARFWTPFSEHHQILFLAKASNAGALSGCSFRLPSGLYSHDFEGSTRDVYFCLFCALCLNTFPK